MTPYLELPEIELHTTNANIGVEKHGKGKKIRLDIDGTATIDAVLLEKLAVDADEAPEYQNALFSDDGKPKDSGVDKLVFNREFKDHIVVIDNLSSPISVQTKAIKKFKAVPTHGGCVDLSFQIQIYPDDAAILWNLVDLLHHDKRTISIEKPDQVDIEEGDQEPVKNELSAEPEVIPGSMPTPWAAKVNAGINQSTAS